MQFGSDSFNSAAWWLGLAIVPAGLAESKGRPRWTWFALGLLLGPLATALVVVWPRVVPVRTQ